MNKLTEMLEASRRDLENLIKTSDEDLTKPFIVSASQKLDKLINEYNKLQLRQS